MLFKPPFVANGQMLVKNVISDGSGNISQDLQICLEDQDFHNIDNQDSRILLPLVDLDL